MPTDPHNPVSLEELGGEPLADEVKTFVRTLSKAVEQEKTHRATWEQHIDRYRNLRYGIRNVKTHPWPGCANYVLGLIDSHIQRLKPAYVNVGWAVSPVCTFEPFGPEDVEPARKRELVFDWRMRTQVKFFEQYCYGVDKLLADGAVVFKTRWRYETGTYAKTLDLADLSDEVLRVLYAPERTDEELFAILQEEVRCRLDLEENGKALRKAVAQFRAGKTRFELTLHEITVNRPQVIARDLREDVVLPIYTLLYEDNLDGAAFIDDRVWTTVNDLRLAMNDGTYAAYTPEEVKAWVGKGADARRQAASSNTETDEDVLLHEVCCWYDVNGDGVKERCIATYPDANPAQVLRFIELPYDHGQWPYTLVKRELCDPTVYSSRGLAALDEDYQVGISTAFNQAVDNGTIVNTPQVIYRRNTLANVRNVRYIPGEPVETLGPTTDYEIRQQANASQGTLFQQAQYLKGWADARVGDLTAAMTSPTNLPGLGEGGRRTRAEVQLVSGLQAEPQALDLLVFQQQMARVYAQVDALYEQFGEEEEYVLLVNEQPTRMTRREIQGKFNIVPTGRLENNNPQLRAQKTFNLMRVFAGDPDVRQYELKRLFLQDYDARVAGKVLLSPEEVAQRDTAALREQEMMKQILKDELLSMEETKDALELKKELGLAAIHGRKYAPDEGTRGGEGAG